MHWLCCWSQLRPESCYSGIGLDTGYRVLTVKPLSQQSPRWRLSRLQLVFWLDAIPRVLAFLIIIIANDLRDISLRALAIASFLFLVFCDLSSIRSYCNRATVSSVLSISFSLMSPFFLFFPGFFLGLSSLLGFIGFILEWGSCAGVLSSFRLIVQGIEAHL